MCTVVACVSDDPNRGLHGHLEVTQEGGSHWLRLVQDEGGALLTGGPHRTLTEVLDVIARLRNPSATWRARLTATGEYYFCVMDDQGEVLGTSAMYVAPADRDQALAHAQALVPETSLVVHGMGRRG